MGVPRGKDKGKGGCTSRKKKKEPLLLRLWYLSAGLGRGKIEEKRSGQPGRNGARRQDCTKKEINRKNPGGGGYVKKKGHFSRKEGTHLNQKPQGGSADRRRE